jgi:hypothetical protein
MAPLKDDEAHTVTFVVRGPKTGAQIKKYMKALRRAIGRGAKIAQKKARKTKARRRRSR